jgi:uncharacterized protein (DUF58 family)
MDAPREFHYRLPGRISGQRPGSHPGSSVGAGQAFVAHRNLYDFPDPRRLDLRASLRTLQGDWLVRVNRQRTGTTVRALVDVSASMSFGSSLPKLHVVADLVEALGLSAFRVGDAVGMMAFDSGERTELFVPARVSRGMGAIMAAALRQWSAPPQRPGGLLHSHGASSPDPGGPQHGHGAAPLRTRGSRSSPRGTPTRANGLEDCASRLAGQQGLVFLISDFHWLLSQLNAALDLMSRATVIPIVVWDPAETNPPTENALAFLSDMESNSRRTLWLRPRLREGWRRAVERRRAEIDEFFHARTLRPFYMEGAFDADALSRYFFEADT